MPSNKKILITEDEGIVALEIRETLENLGYYVVGEAQTGQEAIELARDAKPDLVLMDITLQGDMDGIEAAERIYNLYDIPIIFLTSHSDEATIKKAMRSNPFGYLIKPFNDRELYSNIEMTLHKHSVIKKVEPNALIDSTLRLVSDAVITVAPDGEITRMNPPAQSLTGYSREEATDYDIFHLFRHDRKKISDMMESLRSENAEKKNLLSWMDSVTLTNRNGEFVPMSLNIGFVKGNRWNSDEYFFVLIPYKPTAGGIGEGESSLERYYRIVLDAIKDSVCLIDSDFKIVVYNSAFSNLCIRLGADLNQLEKPVYDILPNDIFGNRWDYKDLFDSHRSGVPSEIAVKERSYIRDKVAHYLNIETIALSNGSKITHFAIICFDVTREKEVEERDEKLSRNFRAQSRNIEAIADICARLKPPLSTIKKVAGPQNSMEFRKVMKAANELSDLIFQMDMKWLKYERIKSLFTAMGMDLPDDKGSDEDDKTDAAAQQDGEFPTENDGIAGAGSDGSTATDASADADNAQTNQQNQPIQSARPRHATDDSEMTEEELKLFEDLDSERIIK